MTYLSFVLNVGLISYVALNSKAENRAVMITVGSYVEI